MSVNTTCIQVDGLFFRYDTEWVLKDVSFRIDQGDYVGIIGPNGGGKTTLIKILLGLLKPSKGKVYCACTHKRHLGHRIGYVPQALAEGMRSFPATVGEVVGTRAMRSSASDKEHRQVVRKALEQSSVLHLEHQLIGELSGGQLQRVLVARALSGNPEVLILDEPTLAIDVAGKNEFYQFLAELNKQGISILMVSHDIDTVAAHVKHVLCVNQTLVCHGAPKKIMSSSTLEELYGSKVGAVSHDHIHQH